MSKVFATVVLIFGLVEPVPAQATIPIGNGYPPWGAIAGGGPIVMLPDGEQIFAVETQYFGCYGGDKQQVVSIRPDGTDRRILLTSDQIHAVTSYKGSVITFMRVSGDGKWLFFIRPDGLTYYYGACVFSIPYYYRMLNTETEAVGPFLPDGLLAQPPSWTDDGQTTAFGALNPTTNTKWFYVGGPDGSGAAPFLEAPANWLFSEGLLSGDGSRFLILVGYNAIAPIMGDVFVFDFATGVLTKVTPAIVSGISLASFSGDGSRVVHDDDMGATYAVNGDGSNYRLLAPPLHYRPTITRSGEYVFVAAQGADQRLPWLGGPGLQLPGYMSPSTTEGIALAPIDAGGTIGASWGVLLVSGQVVSIGPNKPLSVWHEQVPVLATYGEGAAETPLFLTVGGKPGTPFVVAWSLLEGSVPVGGLGTLLLDPLQFFVLGAGTITSVSDTGTLEVELPLNLNLPFDLPVHFQALGFTADGAKFLTNRTTFTLPATPPVTPADQAGAAASRRRRDGAELSRHEAPDAWTRHLMTDPTLPLRAQPPGDR